jgi:hypothetical protein
VIVGGRADKLVGHGHGHGHGHVYDHGHVYVYVYDHGHGYGHDVLHSPGGWWLCRGRSQAPRLVRAR